VLTYCCTSVGLYFLTPSESVRSRGTHGAIMLRTRRFAIVVIPVYEDPDDRASSSYDLPNVEPFAWSWLGTLNRVNSQVHKVRRRPRLHLRAHGRLTPRTRRR
jgi:hypothetical protein